MRISPATCGCSATRTAATSALIISAAEGNQAADFFTPRYSSSSSSGFSSGLWPGDSCGNCRPCFKPPDFSESGWSLDGGGDWRGPLRGANLAEGDGREEGESSGACRGEMSER